MRSVLFLLFLFVGACGDVGDSGSKEMSGNGPSIQIQMQKNASDLVAASPVQFSEECMSEVNMCWYKIEKSFGDPDLPTVVVNGHIHVRSPKPEPRPLFLRPVRHFLDHLRI
jgi:hypothetical protein